MLFLLNQTQAVGTQSFVNFLDMHEVTRFDIDAQNAGRDGGSFTGFFVADADYIGIQRSKQLRNFGQLTWTVFQLNSQGI